MSNANNIVLTPDVNSVSIEINTNQIDVVDNGTPNTISVPQPVTQVIQVATPGPQGPAGQSGAPGQDSPFTQSIGTNDWQSTANLIVTGSITVSGSGTFTNIGPAVFDAGTGGSNFFIIQSGSVENLKFNTEGIAQFFSYANSYEPTATLGGLYFTSASLYIGIE